MSPAMAGLADIHSRSMFDCSAEGQNSVGPQKNMHGKGGVQPHPGSNGFVFGCLFGSDQGFLEMLNRSYLFDKCGAGSILCKNSLIKVMTAK